jgi:RNA recognition motif-containing protein
MLLGPRIFCRAVSRVPAQSSLSKACIPKAASRLSLFSFSTSVEEPPEVAAHHSFHETDNKEPPVVAAHDPPPISEQNLFVGNLPHELEDEALHELFAPYSPNNSQVARFADSGKSKGFGFVQFSDTETATTAVRALDGTEFLGQMITVSFKSRSKPQGGCKLYVGNLPWTLHALDLKQLAAEFGEVATSNVVTDAQGNSRGFGFLTMSSEEQAKDVIAQLHQTDVQGRKLSIRFAIERKRTRTLHATRSIR